MIEKFREPCTLYRILELQHVYRQGLPENACPGYQIIRILIFSVNGNLIDILHFTMTYRLMLAGEQVKGGIAGLNMI